MEIDLVPDSTVTICMTLAKMRTILTSLFTCKAVLSLLGQLCECEVVLMHHMDCLASVSDGGGLCAFSRGRSRAERAGLCLRVCLSCRFSPLKPSV